MTPDHAVSRLVLERLESHASTHGLAQPHLRDDGQIIACCPAHNDKSPSLQYRPGEKRAFLNCRAGCDEAAILLALGIEERSLWYHQPVAGVTSGKKRETHRSSGFERESQQYGVAVLECLFSGGEEVTTQLDEISSSAFLDKNQRHLFEAIRECWEQNKVVDPVLVESRLGDRPWLLDDVLEQTTKPPTPLYFDRYLSRLNEIADRHATVRNVERSLDDFGHCGNYEEFVQGVQEAVSSQSIRDARGNLTPTQGAERLLEHAEENMIDSGLSFGLPSLEAVVGSLRRKSVYVIAAATGVGKTTLALSVAHSVAQGGSPVLYFSLEMGAEQLWMKLFARDRRVDVSPYLRGDPSQAQAEAIIAFVEDAPKRLPIFVNDRCSTLEELEAAARTAVAKGQAELIVVDHLHLLRGPSAENRQREVSLVSQGLKHLAMELDRPVLLLSQLNRAADRREDKHPVLSDLRDSGSIEENADCVMLLYRDDYYNPNSRRPGEVDIRVAKNRLGKTGVVTLGFNGQHSSFDEYDEVAG